jgi:hypothetical protein
MGFFAHEINVLVEENNKNGREKKSFYFPGERKKQCQSKKYYFNDTSKKYL